MDFAAQKCASFDPMPKQANQRVVLESGTEIDARLDAFRQYIDAIIRTGRFKTRSSIARAASLHPSTVNRPYKAAVEGDHENVKSNVKSDTLLRIRSATGVTFPEKLQLLYGLGAIQGVRQEDEPTPNVRRITDDRLNSNRKGPDDMPVRGVVQGGEDGAFDLNMGPDPIEYMRRPVSLVGRGELYAVHIDGSSMWPAYRPGETALVWANKPALIGRDVVIQVRPKHEGDPPLAYLKTLVKRNSAELVVEQYNPPKRFTFKTKDVLSVHMVLTRDEMI